MSIVYTKQQIRSIAKALRIRVTDGRVTAIDAANILTWRARQEYDIMHIYTPTTVRKHRAKLDPTHPLKEDGTINTRANLYDVEKVFALDIAPQRTNKSRWKEKSEEKQ